MRDLTLLPKAHLHVHLEGAMRPATLADIAAGYGIEVPATRGYGSFAAFSELYRAAEAVLQTEPDVRRVVREVVEDAAADGAVYIEPQMYPGRYAHRLGSSGDVLDLIIDEGRTTAGRLGIGFGLQLSADRNSPPADAEAMARLAAERAGAGMVSFGLAADEASYPPEPFAKAFAIAREAGLISAPHAGEHGGPASVIGALDALGAQRIAHGVRAVESPELVRRLAAEGICLDVCPTSNLMLSVVPTLAEHPLAALIEAGVPCSLNGDDPLLFGPGLLDEYQLARDQLGLDDLALAGLARCSIVHSGADPYLKARGLAGIDAWLASAVGAPEPA
jgi:adenosine deaminase